MIIELRVKFFFIGICLAFLSVSVPEAASGQIKLTGDQTTAIIFSASEEIDAGNVKQINPVNSEIFAGSIALGKEYPIKNNFLPEPVLNSPFYTFEALNEVMSLGFETSSMENGTFATFSFQNSSESPIGELNLAFDWIVRSDQVPELKMQYRVNESGWNDAHEGYFIPPSVTTDDEFISVSMQYSLDQIYVKKDDKIDIRWIWRMQEGNSFFALQSIEARTETIEKQEKLYPGSLIITEILPSVETSDGSFEYFEVYNATNKPISLIGVEIWINDKYEVIQEDIHINPHEFSVFSNIESETSYYNSNYSYNSLSIDQNGGSIKLVYNSVDVSKATYDEIFSGRSWELSNTGDAHDGYASMESFAASESSIGNQIKGSPGRDGSTIRVFSKFFETSGWHLIGMPGIAVTELNRNFPGVLIVNDSRNDGSKLWNKSALTDLSPGSAGLLKIEPEESGLQKIMATEIPSVQSFKIDSENPGLVNLAGNPFPKPITLKHIVNPAGEPAVFAVQSWDPVEKSFRLINHFETEIPYWKGFILPDLLEKNIEIREEPVQVPVSKNPVIQFEFIVQSNNDMRYYDSAAAIKLIQGDELDKIKHQVSKFWPIRMSEEESYSAALIYFTNSPGTKKALAQISEPVDDSNQIAFYLTPLIVRNSGMATLNWTFDEWLPDHWQITLTDLKTGVQIDMREEEIFQFQASESDIRMDQLPAEPGLFPVPELELEPRLKININPEPGAFNTAIETDSETPDAIALNQNYPNPFNPTTNIEFYLPEQQAVKVEIFNVVGQRVAILLENVLQAGEHSIVWDASEMPSGIYIIQMDAGNRVLTRKMTLVK